MKKNQLTKYFKIHNEVIFYAQRTFNKKSQEYHALGHLLVTLVHAPATDRLPLLSSGGGKKKPLKNKREKRHLEERQRYTNTTRSTKRGTWGKRPISGTHGPSHHNLALKQPHGVNHPSPNGGGHIVHRLLLLLLSGRVLNLPQAPGSRPSHPRRRSPERVTPPGEGAGVHRGIGSGSLFQRRDGGAHGEGTRCHRPLSAHAQCCGRRAVLRLLGCFLFPVEAAGVSCSLWELPVFPAPCGRSRCCLCLEGAPCVCTGAHHGEGTAGKQPPSCAHGAFRLNCLWPGWIPLCFCKYNQCRQITYTVGAA